MEDAFLHYGAEDTPGLREMLGGSPAEVLEATIDFIDHGRGSVHRYLLAHGMAPVDLVRLRQALVRQG
jgi:hypothetical protein